MADDEVYTETAAEVERLKADVSDDLTEQLANDSLEVHATVEGRCPLCDTYWPCEAAQRDEDVRRRIERRRRERLNGL